MLLGARPRAGWNVHLSRATATRSESSTVRCTDFSRLRPCEVSQWRHEERHVTCVGDEAVLDAWGGRQWTYMGDIERQWGGVQAGTRLVG